MSCPHQALACGWPTTSPQGGQGQGDAVFYARNNEYVPVSEREALLADVDEDTRESLSEHLEQISETGYFQMSGGDWEARFLLPHFSRRGLGYTEYEREPLVTITHWRHFAKLPALEEPCQPEVA